MNHEHEYPNTGMQDAAKQAGQIEDEQAQPRERLIPRMSAREMDYYFNPGYDIADTIRDRTRIGPYVSLELLEQIDFDEIRTALGDRGYKDEFYAEEVKNARRAYTTNIQRYGNDAIAHICIPSRGLAHLYRPQKCLWRLPTLSAFGRFYNRHRHEEEWPYTLIRPGQERYAPDVTIISERYEEWIRTFRP